MPVGFTPQTLSFGRHLGGLVVLALLFVIAQDLELRCKVYLAMRDGVRHVQHGRCERQNRTHAGGYQRVSDALRGMRWGCDDPDSDLAISTRAWSSRLSRTSSPAMVVPILSGDESAKAAIGKPRLPKPP